MITSPRSLLLRPRDLCTQTPDWALSAVMDLTREVMNPAVQYPCHFATQVYKNEAFRATFVDEPNAELQQALLQYIEESRGIGPITSFLSFYRPIEAETDVDYKAWFWSVLQYLHDNDPEPWPADIPRDLSDPSWAFCFGGQSFFVVCFTPANEKRRSRHSQVPMIIFQPRWIFKGLEGTSTAGQLARKIIRDRVQAYDTLPPSVNLTSYGEGEDWKQYFLLDRNDDALDLSECPFSMSPTSNGVDLRENHVMSATPTEAHGHEEPRVIRGTGTPPTLAEALPAFLPPSGVIKLVREVPDESNDPHRHPNPETLFILEGTLTFTWGEGASGTCHAGDRLLLPPNVLHSSTAGPQGCYYIISERFIDPAAATGSAAHAAPGAR